MKKRFVLACFGLLMCFIIPAQAFAATITYNLYYLASLDQYRMDYTYPTGTAKLNLHFESPTGAESQKMFDGPTGIMFLTCNGTYSMQFYDAAGSQIGEFFPFAVSQIKNPPCSSYPDQNGANNLHLQSTDKGGGNYDLSWDKPPAGGHSEVYKDGQQVQNGSNNSYTGGKGSYTVINYDQNGNIVGRSDANIPNGYDGSGGTGGSGETSSPGGNGGDGSSCDGCTFLKDMLACPSWGEYMGDLTNAIKNALPPPPDWDSIADKIGAATVSHLSDYLGDVPDPPSKEQIKQDTETSLPNIDLPSSDLKPTVPPDFNQPIPFDISSGDQIEIKDESKPFIITDPLAGMQYDAPGTPVYPGDPRNSSEGIKNPESPVPVFSAPEAPKPTIPADTGGPVPTTPIPSDSGGEVAIPKPSTGIIPIPKEVK